MNIIEQARELLEAMPQEGWVELGGRKFYMHGKAGKADSSEILFLANAARLVRGLLERIQELEQERDAALERIQQLEGQDWFTRAITAEAGVEVLSGRVRDLEWYLEQAQQERDAALERVRALEGGL